MGNKAKKLIMLCILLLGCGLTGYFTCFDNEDNKENVDKLIVANRETAREQANRTMKVYVSGAVMAPGIYDVPIGVRAFEAVSAAGGLTENADADRVNFAKKLKDGDHINVPAVKGGHTRAVRSMESGSALSTKAAGNRNLGGSSGYSEQASVININTAEQKDLEKLPGIGPAMAQRIIAERERCFFSSVDDLLRVKGIGPAKLAKLRDRVRVN